MRINAGLTRFTSGLWALGSGLLTIAILPRPLPAQGHIDLPVTLAELEKRVKADSNDPAAHYNVALAYWNARKWVDVDRELQVAVKLEPRFAEAHLALAFLPYARQVHIWRDLAEATHDVAADLRKVITESDREYRQAFLIDPMVDMRIIAAATPSTVSFWDVQEVLGSIVALYYQGKIDCSEGRYTDCEAKFTRLLADHAVADSVANTLTTGSAASSAWVRDSAAWADRLLPPFLARVRTRLAIPAALDAPTRAAMARKLAAEAATVRWGEDVGREVSIRNDPDVIAAMALFGRVGEILHK